MPAVDADDDVFHKVPGEIFRDTAFPGTITPVSSILLFAEINQWETKEIFLSIKTF